MTEAHPDEAVADEPVADEAVAGEAVADEELSIADQTLDLALPDIALPEPPPPLDPDQVQASVEAILFISDAPLSAVAIAAGIEVPVDDVSAAIQRLALSYRDRGSGLQLREVAGGVRLYTRDDLAPVIEQYLREGQRTRLTQAALETVAVIAYRQPITRARISAIRGVSVDGVIRTLLSRGLIVETGADVETGGILYGTSELFLEKMGLASLDQLPSLAPLLPEIEGLDVEQR